MNSMIPTRYIDVALDSMGKHVEYVEHFDLWPAYDLSSCCRQVFTNAMRKNVKV